MRGIYEKVKGSKNFFIRYTDSKGVRHREHAGSLGEAEEALINRRREIREGTYRAPAERKIAVAPEVPTNTPTFEELFKMRMADLERSLSEKTYRHHEYDFNSPHLESLKTMQSDKIRPKDVEAVLRGLHKAGRSSPTIRNYRSLISAVFRFGILQELLSSNPVLKTKAPKSRRTECRLTLFLQACQVLGDGCPHMERDGALVCASERLELGLLFRLYKNEDRDPPAFAFLDLFPFHNPPLRGIRLEQACLRYTRISVH
jgi:hypothetical protein